MPGRPEWDLTWEAMIRSMREWDQARQRQQELIQELSVGRLSGLRPTGLIYDEVQFIEKKEEPTMAMSKQDYETIARVLLDKRPDPKQATIGERRVWALVVRGLADTLEGTYSGFDRGTFYQACGYTGEGL